MSRRRIILIGIMVTCAALLVLSVMGFFRNPPKPVRADKTEGSAKAPVPDDPQKPSGSWMRGIEHPGYNDDGKRKYVVRAKEAREMPGMKNAPLEMKNAVIEVYDVPGKKKSDPHTMVIRAPDGEWNPRTHDAKLRGDVVVQVDPKTTIRTEEVSYVPRQERVFTDKPVALDGEDVDISGTGLEGDLRTKEAKLLKDVTVVIKGMDGFSLKKKGKKDKKKPDDEKKPKKKLDEPIVITCAKHLLFLMEPQRRATFHDSVKAVRGKSGMDSDELQITFNKEGESVENVVALRNVRFHDKDVRGKADKVVWTADDECAVLSSKEFSEVSQGKNRLVGQIIRFFQRDEKVVVDCPGRLSIESKNGLKPLEKKKPEKADGSPKTIEVLWEKDMLYQSSEAVFRGNVRAFEEDGIQLNADRLQVLFDKSTNKLKKILATGNVVLVDDDRKATGDRFEWDALVGMGVLSSDDTVKVEDGDNLVSGKTLRFWHKEDKLVAEGEGFLVGSKTEKGTKGKEAIHVIWEKGMSFDRAKHIAVFEKNVEAQRGETKLNAQELRVQFDDENRQVRKIIAKKQVTIREGERSGTGEEATYDALAEEAVLVGAKDRPAKVVQDGDKSIEAPVIYMSRRSNAMHTDGNGHLVFTLKEKDGKAQDVDVVWTGAMDFDTDNHKATFTENVHAKQGERKIDADRLDVVFDDGNREVKQIIALGSVKLIEGARNGEGDKFVYDTESGLIELIGEGREAVMRSKEGFFIRSETIQHYQKEDKMQAIGKGDLELCNPHAKLTGGTAEAKKIRIRWEERLVFPRSKGMATFLGNVVVISGTSKLEAQRMEIFLDEKEEPREMRAYEDVVVSDSRNDKDGKQGDLLEATGDKMVWKSQDDTAVISGKNGARLYYGGRPSQSPKWYFEGFFAEETGKKRVRGEKGDSPVSIRIPAGRSKP